MTAHPITPKEGDPLLSLEETKEYTLPPGAAVWLHGHWLILVDGARIHTTASAWTVMQACGLMDGAAPGAMR